MSQPACNFWQSVVTTGAVPFEDMQQIEPGQFGQNASLVDSTGGRPQVSVIHDIPACIWTAVPQNATMNLPPVEPSAVQERRPTQRRSRTRGRRSVVTPAAIVPTTTGRDNRASERSTASRGRSRTPRTNSRTSRRTTQHRNRSQSPAPSRTEAHHCRRSRRARRPARYRDNTDDDDEDNEDDEDDDDNVEYEFYVDSVVNVRVSSVISRQTDSVKLDQYAD